MVVSKLAHERTELIAVIQELGLCAPSVSKPQESACRRREATLLYPSDGVAILCNFPSFPRVGRVSGARELHDQRAVFEAVHSVPAPGWAARGMQRGSLRRLPNIPVLCLPVAALSRSCHEISAAPLPTAGRRGDPSPLSKYVGAGLRGPANGSWQEHRHCGIGQASQRPSVGAGARQGALSAESCEVRIADARNRIPKCRALLRSGRSGGSGSGRYLFRGVGSEGCEMRGNVRKCTIGGKESGGFCHKFLLADHR